MINKLKLTLTIKMPSLLYLTRHALCLYIMETLNRPITPELRTLSYLYRIIIVISTRS